MSKKQVYLPPNTGMTPEEADNILDGGDCDNPDLIAEAMNIRQRMTRHLANPAALPPHHPDYDPTQPVKKPDGPSEDDLNMSLGDYTAKYLVHAKSMAEFERLERLWKNWNRGLRPKEKQKKWDFTKEDVLKTFYYHNGELYFRHDLGNNIKAGTMAGTRGLNRQSYQPRRVTFRGNAYNLDSFIWFLHTGEPDVKRLIHKNHNRQDCAFENLKKRATS